MRDQSDAWAQAEQRAKEKKAADAQKEQRRQNKARLTEFFEEHNPEKVNQVDEILDKFAGREDKLFGTLAEQAARKAEAKLLKDVQALPEDVLILKKQLIAFFEKHDVSKIKSVDTLLAKGGGKQLIASLARRYREMPPVVSQSEGRRSALVDFFLRHDPEQVDTVDDLLISSTVEGIAEDLQKRFGTLPDGWTTVLAGTHSTVAADGTGAAPGGEDDDGASVASSAEVGDALSREPSLDGRLAAAPAASTKTVHADDSAVTVTKAQLVAFYSKHDPAKLPTVDKILAHYGSKPRVLVASLQERYGDAPVLNSAADAASAGAEDARDGSTRSTGADGNSSSGAGVDNSTGGVTSARSSAGASGGQSGKREDHGDAAKGSVVTKAQLVAFYSKHDPSKVASVDKILKHYTTAQLVTQLKERYGAAPTPAERPLSKGDMLAAKRRQELVDFYRKHDPEKVAKVGELLDNYPFENIVSSLKIKFKSCPPVRTAPRKIPHLLPTLFCPFF